MANVLIVGADRGIAAELVNAYCARGDEVTAACLGAGEIWEGTPVRVVAGVDVTDDHAVERLAQTLQGTSLDILIHVAGIGSFDRWGSFDYNSMLAHYNLNALGPLRVISAVGDLLVEGAKVGLCVNSGAGGNSQAIIMKR